MHALKKKVMHELEKLEHKEEARSGELNHETLELAYKLAKTYFYLCKLEKMEKGNEGEYAVEIRDTSKKTGML